jgi:hypothetical protein
MFDVIRGVLLLDDACELLVARAEGSAAGVVLTGRTGAFEELAEHVASEASSEHNRRRMRLDVPRPRWMLRRITSSQPSRFRRSRQALIVVHGLRKRTGDLEAPTTTCRCP